MKRLAGLIPAAALVLTVACGQTDAGISTAVETKFAADDAVSASRIDVETANGVVTLTGSVESDAARQRALMLARDTDGVRDVVDNLEVADTAATTGVDRDLGDAARDGADAVVDGVKKGAEGAAEGARRVGEGARDAVTDDNPDTDRDGR